MAISRNKAKAQARTKRGLRKLRDAGLISKKTDLRRAPTKAQKAALKKYSDVVAGKAAVVTPRNAKAYKALYRVKGAKVIVPRRKGERIGTNKAGEIIGRRKTKRGTMKTRHIPPTETQRPRQRNEAITYAVPFKGKGGEIYWRRFTPSNWKAFLNDYAKRQTQQTRDAWNSMIVEERFRFKSAGERDVFEETIERELIGVEIGRPKEKPEDMGE